MQKALISLLVLACGGASANESCDLLLQHGITNITKYQSAEHAVAYKWHKNCGLNWDTASDRQAAHASVSVFGYGSGDGGYNSSQQRQRLNKWCDQNEAFAELRNDLFEESQILSSPALGSWNQCIEMTRKDVNIGFQPAGDNSEFVHFEVDSTNDGTLKFLGIESKNYVCTTKMVRLDGTGVDIDSQPDIRNANIQIDCQRAEPAVKQVEGVGTIKYALGYISINTSGPSFSMSFPEVVEEYTVTPPKSVLAFNSFNCPAGWRPFEKAKGRILLGAGTGDGLTPRELGVSGGAEKHKLVIAEMPKHTHKHNRAKRVKRRNGDHGAAEFNPGGIDKTQPTGGNRPHNNMPPFTVLTYCEKA